MPPELNVQQSANDTRRPSATKDARIPGCPHCGEMLLAPALSEFRGAGRIRHYWSCEDCGAVSETMVKLLAH